ncbi:GerAB/ArcD/ProY family transporter [Paenibacillus whitsoniae]|uniref:Spore gernimation protein n=1 Tax=Paenibacillus whitsoniae TaxID=2496558 RepID=A0A430JD08_9BACL|nr:endospore germination permease [Paenibacillus whitsoniae]RTE08933.1 spore gernimation protein [Paenibacillus whitsoniae]
MNTNSDSYTEEIRVLDMVVTVTSMVVGVGILTLPRVIAKTTQASDGWISILGAGLLLLTAAYILAKYAGLYYKEGFFAFTSRLVSKPIAALLVGSLSVYYICFSAYVIRAIANISKQYLFERTPVEVVALIFLLVLVYSVAGSRIGIIRLNMMFLPIVLFMIGIVLLFSLDIFQVKSLKPFFVSDWKGLLTAAKNSVPSFLGFELILFYISMMRNPHKAPKAVLIGVAIPMVLYIAVYLICVGVFTQYALKEIDYPSIELAKEIQIPGEFFERFESIFFTIWVMTIFNTACMAIDLAVYNFSSLFPKLPHKKSVFILSPFIYFLSMVPKNVTQFGRLGDYVSYIGLLVGIMIPCLLYAVAKIRGVKQL